MYKFRVIYGNRTTVTANFSYIWIVKFKEDNRINSKRTFSGSKHSHLSPKRSIMLYEKSSSVNGKQTINLLLP